MRNKVEIEVQASKMIDKGQTIFDIARMGHKKLSLLGYGDTTLKINVVDDIGNKYN